MDVNGKLNVKIWQGIAAAVLTLLLGGLGGSQVSSHNADANAERLDRLERRIANDLNDIKTDLRHLRDTSSELGAWTAHLEARIDAISRER